MLTPYHPSAHRTVGRVPVALYLASADQTTADTLTARCREYAELRNWTVTVTARDVPPTADAAETQTCEENLNRVRCRALVLWQLQEGRRWRRARGRR